MRLGKKKTILLGFSDLILPSVFQIFCVVNCTISYPDLNYKIKFVDISFVSYNLLI